MFSFYAMRHNLQKLSMLELDTKIRVNYLNPDSEDVERQAKQLEIREKLKNEEKLAKIVDAKKKQFADMTLNETLYM